MEIKTIGHFSTCAARKPNFDIIEIINSFRSGTKYSADFEVLLKKIEHEIITSANENFRHLEHIFDIIKTSFERECRQTCGLSISSYHIKEIVSALDDSFHTTCEQNTIQTCGDNYFSRILGETCNESKLKHMNEFCRSKKRCSKDLVTTRAFSLNFTDSSINKSEAVRKVVCDQDLLLEIDNESEPKGSMFGSRRFLRSKNHVKSMVPSLSRSDSAKVIQNRSENVDTLSPLSKSVRYSSKHLITPLSPSTRKIAPIVVAPVETVSIYPIDTLNKSTSTSDLSTDVSLSDNDDNTIPNIPKTLFSSPGKNQLPASANIDLHSQLRSTDNPLGLLYKYYKDDLSVLSKTRLLTLATGDIPTNTMQTFDRSFTSILQELTKLHSEVMSLERNIDKMYEVYPLALTAANNGDMNEQFTATVEKINYDMGVAVATHSFLNLQLTEYRSLFEKIASTELSHLPKLLQNSVSFSDSHLLFNECQSKLLTVKDRIKLLKHQIKSESSSRMKSSFHSSTSSNTTAASNTTTTSTQNSSRTITNNNLPESKELHSFKEQLEKAQLKITDLEEELSESMTDIVELQEELLESKGLTDKTPGALLFFAILQEDNVIPTLQQLILQLGHIRTITDAAEHMDFQTLRRRLQVCVECLPSIKLLVTKYTTLYQKWIEEKRKSFARRNKSSEKQSESHSLCPLCYGDFQSTSSLTSSQASPPFIRQTSGLLRLDHHPRSSFLSQQSSQLSPELQSQGVSIYRMSTTEKMSEKLSGAVAAAEFPPILSKASFRGSKRTS